MLYTLKKHLYCYVDDGSLRISDRPRGICEGQIVLFLRCDRGRYYFYHHILGVIYFYFLDDDIERFLIKH